VGGFPQQTPRAGDDEQDDDEGRGGVHPFRAPDEDGCTGDHRGDGPRGVERHVHDGAAHVEASSRCTL
jgi:hypothetical protein